MKTQKRDPLLFMEIAIILVIAGCVIFMNIFMQNKINELQQSAQDAVFVMEGMNYPSEGVLMETMQEYIPSTYKMFEIYDKDFNRIMQLQFNDHVEKPADIRNNPQLMEVLLSSEQGQTTYTVDDVEQSIFFRWMENVNGDLRLIIIYSRVMEVQNLWIFTMVSYSVILLAFGLLFLMRYKMQRETIHNYNEVLKIADDHVEISYRRSGLHGEEA